MKAYVLAAIACASLQFTTPATAVNVSTNGVGQALIYPYYTANNGQDTYISITNRSSDGAVVKVRFLEGVNGRPALDFDLFLSPYVTWNAAVSQNSDSGGAVLRSTDHGCTLPTMPAGGFVFSSNGYDGTGALPADFGAHDISRVREGFFEVIAGGTIVPDSPTARAITLVPAATPNAGKPPGCDTLSSAFVADVVEPSNGISGTAAIINVGGGTYFPYNATALASLTSRPLFTSTTGPLEPSLAQANSFNAITGATAYLFADSSGLPDFGALLTEHFESGIDAVAAVLMADSIMNDYLIVPGLGANTDWVITRPTLRFRDHTVYPNSGGSTQDPGELRQMVEAAVYDRQHARALPADQERFFLPYNVSIISFLANAANGAPSGVFGSRLNTNIAPNADSGVIRLDVGGHRGVGGNFSSAGYPGVSSDNHIFYGIPVVGFMAYNIINANAQPGKLANYGSVSALRTTACYSGTSVFSMFICAR